MLTRGNNLSLGLSVTGRPLHFYFKPQTHISHPITTNDNDAETTQHTSPRDHTTSLSTTTTTTTTTPSKQASKQPKAKCHSPRNGTKRNEHHHQTLTTSNRSSRHWRMNSATRSRKPISTNAKQNLSGRSIKSIGKNHATFMISITHTIVFHDKYINIVSIKSWSMPR